MEHGKTIRNRKGLAIAAGITALIMLLEFFGGLATNSLALLSDSGHMLSDVSSLLFSLLAIWLSARPATPEKPYGYHRTEILAALFNGLTLFVIAGLIIVEAYHRLLLPPTVSSGSMILIAVIGLLANVLSAWALLRQGDVDHNINMRSAYLHVLGDALGSAGAIVAGILMYYWNWYIADPIISVLVAVIILRGAGNVIKQAIHILMEGTPAAVNTARIKESLESIAGVKNVHDLRVWSLTSGVNSLCCHLLVDGSQDNSDILQQALARLRLHESIRYSTIQIETKHMLCRLP